MKFKFEKPVKITFHKPCHLKNTDFIKPLFGNCENVEYVEMDGFDDCCGFAGEFALKNHKISKSISDKKAQNIIATGANYVITCCPSCILGLKQGLFGKKGAPKVLSLSEFLLLSNFII
jgi:glycolate oxidase iron-sulfur subunit